MTPLEPRNCCKRVIELRPAAHSLFDYAVVLGMNGKTDKAVECMKEALAFTPNDLDDQKRAAALQALQRWNEGSR